MTVVKRTKPKPKGNSRYPKGKYPVYDSALRTALSNSPILNEAARSRDFKNSGILSNLNSALIELEGNPSRDNYYLVQGQWKLALIPSMKEQIAELYERQKAWAKEQVRLAKALTPPEEWPPELLELRLKKEAILDVRIKEAEHVRKLMKQKEQERQNRHKTQLLECGPIGMMDKGGKGIDGQQIERTAKGVPYIYEPASPYHLMTLFHYKQMSKAWKEEKGYTRQAINKKKQEWHMAQVKKAEEEGATYVPGYPMTTQRLGLWKWADIKKEDWPEWPEGVRPVTELDDV